VTRLAATTVSAFLALAACSIGDGRPAQTSVTDNIVNSMMKPAEADQPILTVSDVCYWLCSPKQWPPSFALYHGGKVILTQRLSHDDAVDFTMQEFDIDREGVEGLAVLMDQAGLFLGGEHQVGRILGEDGGGLLFEATLDDIHTYIHAPWFGDQNSQVNLITLVNQLKSLTGGGGGRRLDVRWWVYGSRGDSSAPQIRWPLAEQMSGDVDCLAIDPVEVEDVFELLKQTPFYASLSVGFTSGDVYATSLLPLLPHELSCHDALNRLERFDAADQTLGL